MKLRIENMTRFYLTAVSFILISQFAIGQTILKKKDVQLKLEIISSEIEKKNFENAMNIFFSKTEIIQKENVSKKMLDKYNLIESTLSQKKDEFDKAKIEVEKYKKYYESNEYCKSTGLLTLNLTNENSYKESQKIQAQFKSKLLEAKQKCETNSEKLIEWEISFKTNEFEQIYHILEIGNSEKNYYTLEDKERLETLQNQLQPKFKTYNNVKENVVIAPDKIMNYINYNTLTYDQSEKLILDLTNINNSSKAEIQKLVGNNPIITDKYNETKLKIEKTLVKFKEFSEQNRPLSDNEIELYLKDNSKQLPIETIFKYFKKIDRELLPYDEWSERPAFYSIYYLDVFSYYKLNDKYDSELKKQVFKKTEEYNKLLTELKALKSQALSSFYYHIGFNNVGGESFTTRGPGYVTDGSVDYAVNYNLKLKAFAITIGEVLPYHCLSSFMPKVIDDLEFSTLPTKKVYDLWQSKNSYREILLIPTTDDIALEIETNRENIEVLLLFQIKGIEKRKLNDIDFQRDNHNNYGCKEPVEVVATKNIRLLIYNKSTNKIYFDKTY